MGGGKMIKRLNSCTIKSFRRLFQRFLAESNCCKRFCRPVPNHSAKEPLVAVSECKVKTNFPYFQIQGQKNGDKNLVVPAMLIVYRRLAFWNLEVVVSGTEGFGKRGAVGTRQRQ